MQTFLIIPTHLLQQLHQVAKNSVQLHVVYTYGPHVSVEALDKYEHVYWDGDGRWVLYFNVRFCFGKFKNLETFLVLFVTKSNI